jgi:hypothetical protein
MNTNEWTYLSFTHINIHPSPRILQFIQLFQSLYIVDFLLPFVTGGSQMYKVYHYYYILI